MVDGPVPSVTARPKMTKDGGRPIVTKNHPATSTQAASRRTHWASLPQPAKDMPPPPPLSPRLVPRWRATENQAQPSPRLARGSSLEGNPEGLVSGRDRGRRPQGMVCVSHGIHDPSVETLQTGPGGQRMDPCTPPSTVRAEAGENESKTRADGKLRARAPPLFLSRA